MRLLIQLMDSIGRTSQSIWPRAMNNGLEQATYSKWTFQLESFSKVLEFYEME